MLEFPYNVRKTGHYLHEVLGKLKLPFELADLQKKDIEDAAAANRFLFAYEVGVGKTVVSTVVASMWDSDHTLVLVPPILKDQWKAWLESVGETDVCIYEGPKRSSYDLNHKWVIMSHAIFRDSLNDIITFYDKEDVAVIVDEAHWIKNVQSKLYKGVYKFVGPDRRILLLTATPTSKPEDTYTYIKIKTNCYRSFGHWEQLYVRSRDIFGSITAYQNLDELKEVFALASVQRTKEEVFGFNLDPIYQPIKYKLSAKHQKLYERLAEEQLLLLPQGDKIDATNAQRLRHALQQIVVNFSKFSGEVKDVSTAYQVLDNTLEDVDPMDKAKSKLVVWTNYVATSESVTAYLQAKFGTRAVVAAYGKVNSAKAIDAIMNDPECRILVAQPRSCGVGLNLQHVCSENLFLEMSTSPMEIRQALGRTWRVGATKRPTFRFAQAMNTIQPSLFDRLMSNDELVSKVEWSKKSLRDEIFGK